MTSSLQLTVEFTGGLELLFSNKRVHDVKLPCKDNKGDPVTIAFLIHYLCENLMEDTRKEMFLLDDHVRPGILVLINDADWELEGEESYVLQPQDTILFLSTLHGG